MEENFSRANFNFPPKLWKFEGKRRNVQKLE
jgi:hypothetical protein